MGQGLAALRGFCRANAFACLVVGYVLFIVLGGLVFTTIEMPVERTLRVQVMALREAFLRECPCIEEGRLDELLRKALDTDERDVAVLKANSDERHYDFTSSLYFVIVTLTTTGYDFFTPISEGAKLFCIFYCTLGVPLTLFLLSLLCDLLLPIVTHAPVHHLHTRWGVPYARAALLHAGLLWAVDVALLLVLPALVFSFVEPEWSFLDALFFCFVTLSTIGQGGYSLGRTWDQGARETLKLLTTCYLMTGLVVVMLFRETAMELREVQAVFRLFAGHHDFELKGTRINEMLGGWIPEDEPQYSLPISTIFSFRLDPTLPSPDEPTPPGLPPSPDEPTPPVLQTVLTSGRAPTTTTIITPTRPDNISDPETQTPVPTLPAPTPTS